MECGHGGVSDKPSLDPKLPLEVQCPLLRPQSEQNRSLGGRGAAFSIGLVHRSEPTSSAPARIDTMVANARSILRSLLARRSSISQSSAPDSTAPGGLCWYDWFAPQERD